MWNRDPRTLLLRALLLDWLGQILILVLIMLAPSAFGVPMGGTHLAGQQSWLLFCLLLYPLLGWLFGSYTVLRWRRLPVFRRVPPAAPPLGLGLVEEDPGALEVAHRQRELGARRERPRVRVRLDALDRVVHGVLLREAVWHRLNVGEGERGGSGAMLFFEPQP